MPCTAVFVFSSRFVVVRVVFFAVVRRFVVFSDGTAVTGESPQSKKQSILAILEPMLLCFARWVRCFLPEVMLGTPISGPV